MMYGKKENRGTRLISWVLEPKEETEFLAKFLLDNLEGSAEKQYEVIVQPRIDSDRPSLALLRRGHGAALINVVDWDPSDYTDYDKEVWTHKQTGKQILSPFVKIYKYKENCFGFHIPELKEQQVKNSNTYAVVAMWVYFHNASTQCIREMNACQPDWWKGEKASKYNAVFNRSMLTASLLKRLTYNAYLSRDTILFTDSMYNRFKEKLHPFKIATNCEPKEVLTKEQKNIINLKKSSLRVLGVVGSGKTTVLVNRVKRFQKEDPEASILILTFNIALRWHLENRLMAIGVDLNKAEVSHYHQFVTSYLLNHDLPFSEVYEMTYTQEGERVEKRKSRFTISKEDVKEAKEQYDYIFVDEIQDFQKEWIETIQNLLKPGGKISYFGDKDQVIYDSVRKKNPPNKNPLFNEKNAQNLKKSFRFANGITNLANDFLAGVLDNQDTILENVQMNLYGRVYYSSISCYGDDIIQNIYDKFADGQLNENEICFLSAKVDPLRRLDEYFRYRLGKQTITTFESQKDYEYILDERDKKIKDAKESAQRNNASKDKLEEEIRKIKDHAQYKLNMIRRSKKFNFNAEKEGIKMSTIHSFKGWEAKNCVLIIEGDDEYVREEDEQTQEERKIRIDTLLYVGLTRCKGDLLVIIINNDKYDAFFRTRGYCEEIVPEPALVSGYGTPRNTR